jgi:predicted esterase
VDLVAGGRDGIIPPANVQAHYEAMRGAGLAVTFKQFQAVGHLDLTFAVREEVRRYVVSRLQLP